MDDFFDDMPRPTIYNKDYYKKWYYVYKKMWEKCKKDIARASVENWQVSAERFLLEMRKLEQKYFPKGVKE